MNTKTMKTLTLILIIGMITVSQAQGDSITWDNCDAKGGAIALKVSQDYPEAFEDILKFVFYKMGKMKKATSRDYVIKETKRQCFGFYLIRRYIDRFGMDKYQENIGQFVSNHVVYVNEGFYIDDYALGKATIGNIQN